MDHEKSRNLADKRATKETMMIFSNSVDPEVDSISECWQFSCHPVRHVIFILLYRKTLFSERTEQYRVFEKCSSVLYTAFYTAPIDVINGVNWCGGETTWILIFKEFMYLFDIFHHSTNYFQTHYSFPRSLSIILSIFLRIERTVRFWNVQLF